MPAAADIVSPDRTSDQKLKLLHKFLEAMALEASEMVDKTQDTKCSNLRSSNKLYCFIAYWVLIKIDCNKACIAQSSKVESLLSIGLFVGFSLLESGGEGIELWTPRVTPLHASSCKIDWLVLRYHNVSISYWDIVFNEAMWQCYLFKCRHDDFGSLQLSVTEMRASKTTHVN